MMKRSVYAMICLLGCAAVVQAQEGTLTQVKVLSEEVSRRNQEVDVRMTLDLTRLRVGRQESVRLQPVVVAKEGTEERLLTPVVIDGKARGKMHRRQKMLGGTAPTDEAMVFIAGKKLSLIHI